MIENNISVVSLYPKLEDIYNTIQFKLTRAQLFLPFQWSMFMLKSTRTSGSTVHYWFNCILPPWFCRMNYTSLPTNKSVSARIWQKDEIKAFREMPQSAKPLGLTALETSRATLHSQLSPAFFLKEHEVLGLYREHSLSSPHLPSSVSSASLVLQQSTYLLLTLFWKFRGTSFSFSCTLLIRGSRQVMASISHYYLSTTKWFSLSKKKNICKNKCVQWIFKRFLEAARAHN